MSDIRDNKCRNDTRIPGYTPIIFPPRDWGLLPEMAEYLHKRGLDPDLAAHNDWYSSSAAGDAIPRIVIPGTMTTNGRFWQARKMQPDGWCPLAPRYQSPHAPREGAIILVQPREAPPLRAAVTEGPMCALAAAGEGLFGIAMMGNTPPLQAIAGLAELLQSLDVTEVLMVEDADSPGSLASVSAYLSSTCGGAFVVRTVVSYPEKDLAACTKTDRARLLR